MITKPGTYVFTIYDTAKNELDFTVTLDNSVSYVLDGAYTLLEDGSYISRKSFTFTVTEPYAIFNVAASNGINVVNGQKLFAYSLRDRVQTRARSSGQYDTFHDRVLLFESFIFPVF